jgi:type IV fimbrial biogenesis protein FimT
MFQRGVTLIELAISLAVLAVVLSTAVPGISDWIDNTRIRAAAQSLRDGIETARNEAVRRNESVSFWLVSSPDSSCAPSGSSMHWVVSIDSPVGKCGAAPSPTAAPRIVMGRDAGSDASKLRVTALQSDGASAGTTLTFNGFGRPVQGATSQIGQIDLTGKLSGTSYRALRITVSGGGQVRVCDPRVVDATDPRKC